MRPSIASLALAGSLATAAVFAQQQMPVDPAPGSAPAAPRTPFTRSLFSAKSAAATKPGGATRDPNVRPATAVIAPTPLDQIKPPTMALPDDPVEPYLLTKDIGPFLVMAKTFRGPDAERYALALVLELRNEYGLPAFILRTKDFPHRSNIRGVPPTAPVGMPRADLAPPERYRSYDEAAVLVGNEKTLAATEKLLHVVKKIRPRCLQDLPALWDHRKDLKYATRTTNPYVPTQDLYPGRVDKLVYDMNQGPHSIFKCPGRYSLEIVNFSGRSTFNVEGARAMGLDILKRSPLATAHDDAERLAAALSKVPEVQQMGQPLYVYHDRHSSRVFIGAFQSPNDPAAAQLREYLVRNATMIMDWKYKDTGKPYPGHNRGIDKMIAPATYLTDLDDPQNPIRPK
jgi:hypothetical protein